MVLRFVIPARFAAAWLGMGLCLASVGLGPPGCDHEHGHGDAGGGHVIYEGGTSHDALERMNASLEARGAKEDPGRAARLSSPAAGALPASPPPAFAWTFGAEARAPAPGFPAGSSPVARATSERALGELFGLWFGAALAGVPSAHAHGEPFSGTGTWLVFEAEGGAPLLRVFTGETSYAPDEAAWTALKGAGGFFVLRLVSADFEEDRIAPGGEPVAGDVVTFTIAGAADGSQDL